MTVVGREDDNGKERTRKRERERENDNENERQQLRTTSAVVQFTESVLSRSELLLRGSFEPLHNFTSVKLWSLV